MSQTVDRETAEQEFVRFCDMMDLDLEAEDMTEDDRASFTRQRETILAAIESGHVSVDDEGQPTIHLKKPVGEMSTLTLYEPTGSTFLARDKGKQDVSKMYSMITDMAHVPPGSLAKLKNRDLKVIQAIAVLFLG